MYVEFQSIIVEIYYLYRPSLYSSQNGQSYQKIIIFPFETSMHDFLEGV